ncbi:TlpA family protein disulfide reductase [Zhouia spongiae]|uniref:TlpA family protein disulfide reductase n=1 Tax=Zhouia spongiae TaxID=2202721 RepID=A0ABY3YMA9_9FLAO|nr:TlpA disulfide reductase family protein [Zhouia spongiae]UNY98930.1 TlpA family protein disulfide reductase [Zhouia spongiae]
MKNLIYTLAIILLTFISCKEESSKDYMSFSGVISNQNSDSLQIFSSKGFKKRISVNPDGTFSDTVKIKDGTYYLLDGTENTNIYLKNGYDLKLTLDTKTFDESIEFSGTGAEPNNYLAQSFLLSERVGQDSLLFALQREDFYMKMIYVYEDFKELLLDTKNVDSVFIKEQTADIEKMIKYMASRYEHKLLMKNVLVKGNPSPKFIGYENFNGGTTSLADFKGKYVYLDIWATWCGPCKREIPFLKTIEKKYHGKNIEFVSISVDKVEDHDKWKTMVKDKELSGVQLFANNKKDGLDFIKNYGVKGIPRFILIDPDGNIVSANAPRPSDDELIALFNDLNI